MINFFEHDESTMTFGTCELKFLSTPENNNDLLLIKDSNGIGFVFLAAISSAKAMDTRVSVNLKGDAPVIIECGDKNAACRVADAILRIQAMLYCGKALAAFNPKALFESFGSMKNDCGPGCKCDGSKAGINTGDNDEEKFMAGFMLKFGKGA